ncbi:MAG: hypothetical protein ACRCZO_19770 [Cetobacterium sp.]|uniref:hypothetical protein n=1 Tax=Cetobacterium sp. TaxID=2071632 RepID=UPI003F40F5F7
MFNKEKFEEVLKENFLEKYDDDKIIVKDGVYSLAYTTSEDNKDEYSLEFNSNKMELNYLKNNKKVYKEIYNFQDIIETIECDLVEILLENV